MAQRRTYTKEFKREAVALLLSSGRSVTEVAKELGSERVNLFRWKREHEEGSLQGTAPSGPESEGWPRRTMRPTISAERAHP